MMIIEMTLSSNIKLIDWSAIIRKLIHWFDYDILLFHLIGISFEKKNLTEV